MNTYIHRHVNAEIAKIQILMLKNVYIIRKLEAYKLLGVKKVIMSIRTEHAKNAAQAINVRMEHPLSNVMLQMANIKMKQVKKSANHVEPTVIIAIAAEC